MHATQFIDIVLSAEKRSPLGRKWSRIFLRAALRAVGDHLRGNEHALRDFAQNPAHKGVLASELSHRQRRAV